MKEFKKSRTSNLKIRANGCYYGVAKQKIGFDETTDANGKKRLVTKWRIRKKSFGKCTLENAQEQLREFLADVHNYAYEPRLDPENPESINTLMGGALDKFEKEETERKDIGPDQKLLIKNRIKFIRAQWPELLPMQPDAVTRDMVSSWHTRLERDGYGPRLLARAPARIFAAAD